MFSRCPREGCVLALGTGGEGPAVRFMLVSELGQSLNPGPLALPPHPTLRPLLGPSSALGSLHQNPPFPLKVAGGSVAGLRGWKSPCVGR